MASIADFFINVGADISDFKKQMSDMQSTLKGAGDGMKSVGSTLSKAVTAPIVGVGAAAFAAANEFDQASNNIRAGAGATGEALTELEGSFKEVFKGVPQSADEVSNALADINTRTGLTGQPLEDLTTKFLNLSKITGEDVSSSIADMTRTMGAWDISAEESGSAMDYLWKVSQTTGIGVGELQSKLVDMGPTFQALGFSMEESAALMGQWEKAGINSSTMMTGLKKSLQTMAEAGQEPAEAFPKLVEEIKSAGSESEAAGLAMDLFGRRAGPEMASAIRDGALGVDELMATLDASGETIGKAAEDTLSLGDQFSILKNNTMAALEPIGSIMLDLAKQYLPPLIEAVGKLAAWFENLSPGVQSAILVVAGIAAAIGPLLVVAGMLVNAVAAMIPLFTAVGGAIAGATIPIWPIIAAVAALIAIGVLLYKNWDVVKEYAIQAWGAILDFIRPAIEAIRAFVMDKFTQLKNWWLQLWPTLQQAFTNIWNGILAFITPIINGIMAVFKFAFPFILSLIKSVWGNIQGVINGALNIIMGVVSAFANLFTGNWQGLWESVKQIISGALTLIWNLFQVWGIGKLVGLAAKIGGKLISLFTSSLGKVKGVFTSSLQAVQNGVIRSFSAIQSFITTIINACRAVIQSVLGAIKGIFSSIFSGIKTVVSTVLNYLVGFITRVLNGWKNIFTSVFSGIKSVVTSSLNLIKSIFSSVFNAVRSVVSGALNSIRSVFSSVFSAIRSVVSSVLNSIRSTFSSIFNSIKSVVSNAISGVKNTISNGIKGALNLVKNLGSSFKSAGKGLIDMMAKGITGAIGKVTGAVKNVAGKVRDFLPFSPAKTGPLSDLDHLDFGGPIEDSITGGLPGIRGMMEEALRVPDIEASANVNSDYGQFNNGNQSVLNFERMFDGANINVNDENDALTVAKELYRMTTDSMRSKGVKNA